MQSLDSYQLRQTIQTGNGVEKETIMKAILLHFLSNKDKGEWPQPLLCPQHSPCLGSVYSFTKITSNTPEFTASPALPWGFPLSLLSARFPNQHYTGTNSFPLPSQYLPAPYLPLLHLLTPGLVGSR